MLKTKYLITNKTDSIVVARAGDEVYSIAPKSTTYILKAKDVELVYPEGFLEITEVKEEKNKPKEEPKQEKTSRTKRRSKKDKDVKIETEEV